MRDVISTPNAPAAIGTYSQAVRSARTLYLSGQIGLDPNTMELAEGVEAQAHQVFKNLIAVIEAAGGKVQDLVKLNIFLTDLNDFALINSIMARYCPQPYPARAAVQVSALPKGALVEVDGIAVLDNY